MKTNRGLRNYIRAVFAMVIILALFSACKKSQPLGPRESSKDRLPALKSSASDLELDQANSKNTAVEFSWSSGSNHGTNSAIDYTLQFDMKGNDFASPLSIGIGRGSYSKAYTVSEFNTLLTDQLNIDPETTEELEVRIKSTTSDSSVTPDFSNSVTLSATPYKPVSTTLYLIGDAAPSGWDANNATALDPDPDTPYIFTYEGNLAAGDFKFITTLGQFLPSYNKGQDAGHLFHRTDNGQPDDKFSITEPGPYLVTVNLVELTITIEKQPGPPYSQLWVVGSATPNGWDLNNAAEMRQDPGDPFIFDYNEVLAQGEFKIATAKDFNAPFYRPTTNYPDLSNTDVQLSAGDPDNKWYITDPGAYKITLNLRDMTISIQKFTPYSQLWIVGDATPNGWNIDNPNQMQQDPNNQYVFTFNGQLSAGEFKFPTATGDWGTDYFMPAINHQPLDSTYVRFIPGGSPDNKWQIDTAGTYSIKLNQLYETIEIQKQ
ncbi:MAG: SusF/SusE family outer membrane protein [Balneolaceae bacterium]